MAPESLPAGFGHEICNLLQVVDGYLELASCRLDDETSLRYLANARSAADQMLALCRQLPPPSTGAPG